VLESTNKTTHYSLINSVTSEALSLGAGKNKK